MGRHFAHGHFEFHLIARFTARHAIVIKIASAAIDPINAVINIFTVAVLSFYDLPGRPPA